MKISVRRSGGFANISAHAAIDTATLAHDDEEALLRLVRRAEFPDQPPPPLQAPGAADVYQYEITIDRGHGPRTYRADELTMPKEWRPVVDRVLGSK